VSDCEEWRVADCEELVGLFTGDDEDSFSNAEHLNKLVRSLWGML